jgi:hypothetical protein
VDDGLLYEMKFDAGNGEETAYHAIWTLRTTITRKQVFPAGKTVKVSHRYKPLVGGSVGGALNAEYRNEDWGKVSPGPSTASRMAGTAAFDTRSGKSARATRTCRPTMNGGSVTC